MGEPPQLQGSAMAQADATGGSGAAAEEPGL
jgi:hypothetical protein